MKEKINYWKILSVMFILLILVLTFVLYTNQYYDFNGMKIKKATLNDFSKVMNDKPFRLCSLESNQCMTIGRLK